MHRSFVSGLLAVVASCSFFAVTATEARADESAAPAPPPATTDKPGAQADEPALKRISLELNPLALAVGRYSISGEYVAARHHAVTLNPHYTSTSVKVGDKEVGSLSGFGGELGYRFYTGDKGANGFFVGPSAIVSSFTSDSIIGGASQSFVSYGGAVDLGGQWIIGPGVVLGFGAGLQYTKNSEELKADGLNLASAIIAGGGVRPRLLFGVGYSF